MFSQNIYITLSSKPVNQHYLTRYIKFIKYCSIDITHHDYLEEHHICPKSIFPEYKYKTVAPWNLIKLSARQHFIAHWILSKVFMDSNRYKVMKAFHRMTISGPDHNRYTSVNYQYAKKANSKAMVENNPMKNPEIAAKAVKNSKASWTPERKAAQSAARTGVSFITDSGKQKLSALWTGVSRPKTQEQIDRHRAAQSCGTYITPFGEFYSPKQASDNINNINKLSPHLIKKKSKLGVDGFQFIPNGKVENRGHYKKFK